MIPSWYRSARGSGGGYFRDRALALQQAGWRVAMLAPDLYTPRDLRRSEVASGRGPSIRVEDDVGVETWRRDMLVLLPRLPYRNAALFAWCGLKLFARYVEAHGRPDFVEAHGALNGGVASCAIERRWSVPYILTEHSTAFAQGRLRRWERDLVRRVIAGARECIAVSPQLGELLSQQYPGSRWQYLPNPLGAAFVEDADAPQRDAAEAFVFVCVARLSPEKGHARLIEAFAATFAGDPKVRLRLIGDGPMRAGLERLCEAQGVAGQVAFIGVLTSEQVHDELAAANAFVLASDVETFGVAVIEALACACPAVVTASGGPEHLIEGVNGVVIPTRDPAALREALLRMRREAGRYDRSEIRAAALRLYAPEAFARGFAEILG